MMKILSLLLFSLSLMACTSPHLEIFPKLEDPSLVSKQLTVEDMQDDIDALINGALARHPDLSSYGDINSIQKKASELKLSLNQSLTRTEFYKVVGQLNYLYEDGHSFLIWPYQEYSALKEEGHKAFPLDVTLTTSGEIVIAKDYQSENETIEAGTVVTSINGVSIDIILDTLQQW